MSNKRREKQKKLVRKHVKRPKVKQREKQKKLVSKNVKRLKMQKRGKKKKKLLRKHVKRYESKRKVNEEVTAKAKAEEEAIKKAVEEDAIKKAAALEAKVAEEQAIKKANNDENVDETADVNQTDNEKDVEETDDVEQVLKKIPTMPFLNTSTRSKKKEADKEGFYKGNKATRQKVHDILGIPIRKRKLEDLEQRPFNDPFIVEWEAQYSHLRKPTPPVIGLQISSTHKANFMFKMNFITLFGSTMGKLENGGRVPTKLLKCIKEDDDISDIDWCGYILIACTLLLYLDSTFFPDIQIIRHRPELRSWNTLMMRKRIMMETRKRCLGNLEYHGDFDPTKEQTGLDLYKGFDVYIKSLNDGKPVTME
ncbi:hypothetical protein Tco_0929648, partial [Tanacetum coccineum]